MEETALVEAGPDKQLADYQYCLETIAFKERLEEGYLILAERLREIKIKRLYVGNWEYFYHFLAEMGMKETTVNKMIAIYEKFIVTWKFKKEDLMKAGGWSSISELMPIIKTREDAKEALHQASTQTRDNLRRYVMEKKTGIPMEKCDHEFYTIQVCKKCGQRHSVV